MLRIGSAVVLLALILTVLWVLPFWATLALAAAAAALAGPELAGMAAAAGAAVPRLFVGTSAAVVCLAFFAAAGGPIPGSDAPAAGGTGVLASVLLALVMASALITLALGPPGAATLTRVSVMTMAPLYVGLPLGAIAWLQWAMGPPAISWVLAVVAISDSSQYYTGRAFGRTKLAPLVSPAKTREGAIGGLAGAALAGGLLAPLWLPALSPLAAGLVALSLALAGIAGDLFESLLKRSVGLKDSSALIPGHGGVLDRIDSHLFAAPVFYVIVRFLA
jgi:phosphatidate cytidylyltransferase